MTRTHGAAKFRGGRVWHVRWVIFRRAVTKPAWITNSSPCPTLSPSSYILSRNRWKTKGYVSQTALEETRHIPLDWPAGWHYVLEPCMAEVSRNPLTWGHITMMHNHPKHAVVQRQTTPEHAVWCARARACVRVCVCVRACVRASTIRMHSHSPNQWAWNIQNKERHSGTFVYNWVPGLSWCFLKTLDLYGSRK
jgi:hypothetical protein